MSASFLVDFIRTLARFDCTHVSATIVSEGSNAEGGGTHIDFHLGARTRPPHCVFLLSYV
jgi:hypothetical protein